MTWKEFFNFPTWEEFLDIPLMTVPELNKFRNRKRIKKMTRAFHEGRYFNLKCAIHDMFYDVAPPWKFKRAEQFLEAYQFTDKELLEITGKPTVEEARKIILSIVQRMLDAKTYTLFDWFNLSRDLQPW